MATLLTPKETAAIARKMLAEQIAEQVVGVNAARFDGLANIITVLENEGYIAEDFPLAQLSLWPHVFQEAMYDDIDWHARDPGKLRHLRPILELDFLVQMQGRRWEDASDEEAMTYRRRQDWALNWRTKQGAWIKEQRELAAKLGAQFFAEPP